MFDTLYFSVPPWQVVKMAGDVIRVTKIASTSPLSVRHHIEVGDEIVEVCEQMRMLKACFGCSSSVVYSSLF